MEEAVRRKEKVVVGVIGGGIAGVAAAREVQERIGEMEMGVEVVLLEADERRLGGRIHTDVEAFGFPVELGASWIHGDCAAANPVAAVAAAAGLRTYRTAGPGSPLYDHDAAAGFALFAGNGAAIPRAAVLRFDRRYRRLLRAARALPSLSSRTSVKQAVQQLLPMLLHRHRSRSTINDDDNENDKELLSPETETGQEGRKPDARAADNPNNPREGSNPGKGPNSIEGSSPTEAGKGPNPGEGGEGPNPGEGPGEGPGEFDAELLAWYLCRAEGWYAASIADIPAEEWANEVHLPGGHSLPVSGYSALLHHLAAALPCVRLNAFVASVTSRSSSSSDDNDRELELRGVDGELLLVADFVIVAVPLGVLKSAAISFHPPLPARKQLAIDRLRVGHQNKVALLFDSCFWPPAAEFLGGAPSPSSPQDHPHRQAPSSSSPEGGSAAAAAAAASGSTEGCSYFLSLSASQGRPALVFMPAGDAALQMEQMSDGEATETAMAALRRLFPDAPKPIASMVTRWGSHPHFLGCYSFLPMPAVDDEQEQDDANPHAVLAEPILQSTILFAGEATSVDHAGSVHGAFQSGIAAAQHIICLLKEKNKQEP